MKFEYKEYCNVTLILPIIIIVSLLLLFILASYEYWVKGVFLKKKLKDAVSYCLCAAIVISCVVVQAKYLFCGGMYLIAESEQEMHALTGVIEDICEPSERFHAFKSNHKYGADITINGQIYFALTAGTYKEGDCVIIQYLPKSRFILGMYEVQEK